MRKKPWINSWFWFPWTTVGCDSPYLWPNPTMIQFHVLSQYFDGFMSLNKKKGLFQTGYICRDLVESSLSRRSAYQKSMRSFEFCHIRCRRTRAMLFSTDRCTASVLNDQNLASFFVIEAVFLSGLLCLRYSLLMMEKSFEPNRGRYK